MAALAMKEDPTTRTLTLSPALLPRLGGLIFSLFWLGLMGVLVLPAFIGDQADWGTLAFVILFALFPIGSSVLSTLVTTTVTIDAASRMVSSIRQLLVFPIGGTTISFSDLASIQVEHIRRGSRNSSRYFMVSAAARDGKRVLLNWNGGQREMEDLAQKVSALTGAPVAESAYQLPTVVKDVLKRIAPDIEQMVEQQESAPAPSETPAEAPAAPAPNELSGTEAPAAAPLMMDTEPANTLTDAGAPQKDVRYLSLDELEDRVKNDAMDSDARYALARQVASRGQVDRAIALYQEVLRLDPTNAGAQNDLGIALQSRGKRAEAEAAYRRAIALDPFSSTAHLNLGLLLSGMKRAAEASQEFYQARQNARGDDETRAAEAASTGGKMEPRLSKT